MFPPPEREGVEIPLSQFRDGRLVGVVVRVGRSGVNVREGRDVPDRPTLSPRFREGAALGSKLAGLRIMRWLPGVLVCMELEDMLGRGALITWPYPLGS